MRILPMYENTPGMPDLVHHTAKHFLGSRERQEWDRLPGATTTAAACWAAIRREPGRAPAQGRFPSTEWWSSPWVGHVRRAHDQGYRPRYELLIDHAGDPSGPAWEPAAKGRRVLEHLGFRVVVDVRGDRVQAITALHSPHLRGAGALAGALPALRAFAERLNCPPSGRSGVSRAEDTP